MQNPFAVFDHCQALRYNHRMQNYICCPIIHDVVRHQTWHPLLPAFCSCHA